MCVGIPCKRLLDTVTVKCGHCSNLSFLTIRPSPPDHLLQPPPLPPFQSAFSGDLKRGQSSSSSSSTSNEPTSPKAPFVVKRTDHCCFLFISQRGNTTHQSFESSNTSSRSFQHRSKKCNPWAGHIPNGSISGSINTD
uniref:YABBY N-terminal domain-containing protein n=1 Tax=Lactuca sativa TaxID=4236 RepID=A0A9R1XNS5_LACSA|nr:hypothetical protein LSAT_V11C300123000 [Lactuca sativa]